VIADHLGGMLGPSKLSSSLQSSSTLQPGFKSLLLLAKQSCVYVKISGLYRMSNEISSNFSDLELIVRTFSQEIPDQVIWGSDWPHTGEGKNRSKEKLEQKEAFRVIDNHVIMKQLQRWMGSDVYRKMLVDNPSCLYT
jgi:predicted TIM-barrel fold metal-dependent hydrolase